MKTKHTKLTWHLSLIICFIVLKSCYVSAQPVVWIQSPEFSKELAKENKVLILADFWADWCPPCIAMDETVWNSQEIESLTRGFVCSKFDLSNGWQSAIPYSVESIPTIVIMDLNGDVLYRKSGFTDTEEMKNILSSFAIDASHFSRAMEILEADPKNAENLLMAAFAAQQCAVNTGNPARAAFRSRSRILLSKAGRKIKKNGDPVLTERLMILLAFDQVLRGKEAKANSSLEELIPSVKTENQALAFYALVKANLGMSNTVSGLKYYRELMECPGSQTFVMAVENNFK